MSDLRDLLSYATVRVADYREGLAQRPVFPRDLDLDRIRRTLGSLPEQPQPAAAVVEELADLVEPALVASTGPRYFGFVTGGALEAATAADVLAAGWDQNAFNPVTSPGAALVEDIAGGWLKDLLGLPPGCLDRALRRSSHEAALARLLASLARTGESRLGHPVAVTLSRRDAPETESPRSAAGQPGRRGDPRGCRVGPRRRGAPIGAARRIRRG